MSLVDSRSEELLRAALGEEANPEAPQSRVEKILASIAGEEVQLDEPQSRVEVLLKALAESGGGGSGGMSNMVVGDLELANTTGVQSFDIPYSGQGYPQVVCIYPKKGLSGDSKISGSTFGTAIIVAAFKRWFNDSTSSSKVYTLTVVDKSSTAANVGSASDASATIWYENPEARVTSSRLSILAFNNKKLSLYVKDSTSSSYGFRPTGIYSYIIIYSE